MSGARGKDESDNPAANPVSIDSLLDWMCMYLPTEQLPKLFTDIDPLEGGDEMLSKVTFEGTLVSCDVGTSDKRELSEHKGLSENGLSDHVHGDKYNSHAVEDEEIAKALKEEEEVRRKQLLLQYQYENYEDEEAADDPQTESKKSCTIVKKGTCSVEKSVEEIRLEKLEIQIKEDRASLSDDVANYMRSKYELADLKRSLKRTEQLAKGLQKKIAKKKAKELEEACAEEECAQPDQHSDEEDYSGGMFNLFDSGAVPQSSKPEGTMNVRTYVPDLSADIPSDWTGKRPKDLLLEQCQKKKISKPIFSKIPATKNGCSIRVKMNGNIEVVVQHEGPFSSFKDAEHFAATKALYQLDETVQLYLQLPPLFRDLWKSWLEERDADKCALDVKEKNERQARIQLLIQSIKDGLPKQKKSAVMSKDCTKENGKTKEVDDWDQESWDSEQEEEPVTCKDQDMKSDDLTEIGKRMQKEFRRKQGSSGYQKMKQVRASLPMYRYRDQVLETVSKNPVTVLCAETGAGKTTQCSQFILEDALERGFGDKVSIICTQPRRISALSVAERVAEEMDEEIGEHVGYQIRMEAKRSKRTRLMFCTTGVILRRLQDDPDLKGITHVFVDECHERQWQIDFLLIALRRLLQNTRKDLKVVLMSATLDSELFCSFFNGAPFFNIPGRTFPVNQYYLEDIVEASGYVVEEDSRYALRGTRGDNTASLLVTGRGGEKKRTVVSLESELESLEVSELYDGYSMSTRRLVYVGVWYLSIKYKLHSCLP